MKTLARFTTRPSNDEGTTCDLILGKVLHQSDMLKPGHVYEIVDFLGSMIITDVGESAIGSTIKESLISNICWAQECNDIVTDGSHLLTKEEAALVLEGRLPQIVKENAL